MNDKPDPIAPLPPASTSIRIIRVVVFAIALNATIGISSLAFVMIFQRKPDPVVLTAFVGIVNYLAGALSGLLVNTRTQPSAAPLTTEGATEVKVINEPSEPVPTTDQVKGKT